MTDTNSYPDDVDRLVALANRLVRERNEARDQVERVRKALDEYTGEAPAVLIAHIREALDGTE